MVDSTEAKDGLHTFAIAIAFWLQEQPRRDLLYRLTVILQHAADFLLQQEKDRDNRGAEAPQASEKEISFVQKIPSAVIYDLEGKPPARVRRAQIYW